MRKITFILALILGVVQLHAQTANSLEVNKNMLQSSIYDFTVDDINGEPFSFESLRGSKVMIVNTASECGLTPQYKELQELYNRYSDQGFVIIGFPANNFGQQEPGSNMEIASFCKKNFGVTFPMMSKISVNGGEIHPLYYYLTNKILNGVSDSNVLWNFQKYLIDENGKLAMVLNPKKSPMSEQVINWIMNKK